MKSPVYLAIALIASAILSAGCSTATRSRFADLPEIVLWSWERADDLEFIDANKVAVARYAGTIMLGENTATLIRRHNPIRLSPTTKNFPVFRLEVAHKDRPVTSDAFSAAKDLIIAHLSEDPQSFVQIDFDATTNDRKNYLEFLSDLRQALPKNTALSITALGSWCLRDKWLQAAPVDETVAMIFSMGEGKSETMSAIENQKLNSGAHAIQSLGISINEPKTNERLRQLGYISSAPRIYAFSSLGWTKHRYDKLIAELTAK